MSEDNTKTIVCEYCNETFATKSNMYRHARKSCKVKKQLSKKKSKTKPESSNTLSELVNIIKTQQEQINNLAKQQHEQMEKHQAHVETLAHLIKNKPSAETVNNTSTNTVIQNNNNIIYVTDQLDYLEILDAKFGGEKQKTIEFIKNKLHGKLQGEIDVFSAIHLSGPPNTWPIKCPDKSKQQFYLVQPDNTLVPDPGGVTTHKNFYRNLQIAVLKLINLELNKVIDKDVGSEEFETLRDGLLDDFDLQAFQTRALEMSHQKPGPFVKRLVEEMGHRESANR